ncbi:MAG: sigma-54-dependent Fis family transcriptional regulator [Clostridium sp.]|nr:sigma-54-dependent Fis family transcriptional regulator [Clostridium sp.]
MSRNKNFKILIVDDEIEYQNVVSLILSEEGYTVETCSNGREALKMLKVRNIDLLITDLRMPEMGGFELIDKVKESSAETSIVVMTAYASVESAINAMHCGAEDYYLKSNNLEELIIIVARIAKMAQLEKRASIFANQHGGADIFLDTKNNEYARLLEMCRRTASTDINILLLGESGVGKEIFANYIHKSSDRSKEPFVPVNCQTYAEGMIESELFGHEKGSFTGAIEKRIGRFEEANYGTLFLDEVGDLHLPTQVKLLRALETKSIERVGSNKQIDLDIRLISATNKNLNDAIDDKKFREDLLYRINTLTITVPPLRHRKEDLDGLISFFINKIETDQKKKIRKIDDDVMKFLKEYDYPGNIRELKNILERMIALSRDGRITLNELFKPQENTKLMRDKMINSMDGESLREARSKFEEEYIAQLLNKYNNDMNKCADALKITKRQLWNKVNQYGLEKK